MPGFRIRAQPPGAPPVSPLLRQGGTGDCQPRTGNSFPGAPPLSPLLRQGGTGDSQPRTGDSFPGAPYLPASGRYGKARTQPCPSVTFCIRAQPPGAPPLSPLLRQGGTGDSFPGAPYLPASGRYGRARIHPDTRCHVPYQGTTPRVPHICPLLADMGRHEPNPASRHVLYHGPKKTGLQPLRVPEMTQELYGMQHRRQVPRERHGGRSTGLQPGEKRATEDRGLQPRKSLKRAQLQATGSVCRRGSAAP